MKEAQLKEIVACLPRGRTFFHYYPGRFAAMLLADRVGVGGASIQALRKSKAGRFLEVGAVRRLLQTCGDGKLDAGRLSDCINTNEKARNVNQDVR